MYDAIKLDAALPWQLGFQDSATPIHEAIVSLHDSIMFYLIVITVLVVWMLSSTILSFGSKRITHLHSTHGTVIELLWTITPALVLLAIALPSFRLLYLLDEVVLPGLTIKAVGYFGLIPFCLYNDFPVIAFSSIISTANSMCFYLMVGSATGLSLTRSLFSSSFHTRSIPALKRFAGSYDPAHNGDVISVLIGSLLGDGSGNRRYSLGTRFRFVQSVVHQEYFLWLYNFFLNRGYCSNLAPRLTFTSLINKFGISSEHSRLSFGSIGREIINRRLIIYSRQPYLFLRPATPGGRDKLRRSRPSLYLC